MTLQGGGQVRICQCDNPECLEVAEPGRRVSAACRKRAQRGQPLGPVRPRTREDDFAEHYAAALALRDADSEDDGAYARAFRAFRRTFRRAARAYARGLVTTGDKATVTQLGPRLASCPKGTPARRSVAR